MTTGRSFKQVDVFGAAPFKGNPLAVILQAEGLTEQDMYAIARWTNLSETTFVLPASDPAADYRLRIFTPNCEFPFAGHPTLGTAHALLESGLLPKTPGRLVQQCGVGLVSLTIADDGCLAFQSPPATITPLAPELISRLKSALKGGAIDGGFAPQVVNMGIRWLIVKMQDAADCLNIHADVGVLGELITLSQTDGVAVYGPYADEDPADYELRAFAIEQGRLVEDPVTGSANACLARVLQSLDFPEGGITSQTYRVRQGTVLQRNGQVIVTFTDGTPWIGGRCRTLIDGELRFTLSDI